MNKELRNINSNFNIDENRKITGYAIIFDSESNDLGGFTEIIDKNSLIGVIEKSDILCLLNHNVDKGVLARCKYSIGSMILTVDDKGLKYEFDAPKTSLGDELIEGIKRKDITTSSFAFTVKSDKWEKRNNGTYIRTILEFSELFDISPVYKEAYSDTSVALRKLDSEGLNNYYLELRKQL